MVILGKGKQTRPPPCLSLPHRIVMVGVARGGNVVSDAAGTKDWSILKRGKTIRFKKKKKNLWRSSHTSHSHDLSPWQLSPPGWTNWNCLHLCVSISFISCLKVNVPLNEIMHSVWVIWRRVPCLISSSPEDLKQKYIFHANTNTVNPGFQHPSWTHQNLFCRIRQSVHC